MLEKAKIDRINQLARKAKTEGLTEEETQERQALRAEYLAAVRTHVQNTLDNVRIVEKDGSHTPLKRREKPSN